MPVEYVMASFVPSPTKPHIYQHLFTIRNIYKVVLTAASIPNSRYILHKDNHYLHFIQNGSSTRVHLEQGNRAQTAALLAQDLQRAVRVARPTQEPTFQCRIGPLGHLELVAYSAPFAVRFGESTLYRHLGMDGTRTTYSDTMPRADGTGEEHVVRAPFLPARYTSHMLQLRLGVGITRRMEHLEHIIIRRDDAMTYFSSQKRNRQTARLFPSPGLTARWFRFDLLDDSGRRMDLNGLPATFVLAVHHYAHSKGKETPTNRHTNRKK